MNTNVIPPASQAIFPPEKYCSLKEALRSPATKRTSARIGSTWNQSISTRKGSPTAPSDLRLARAEASLAVLAKTHS